MRNLPTRDCRRSSLGHPEAEGRPTWARRVPAGSGGHERAFVHPENLGRTIMTPHDPMGRRGKLWHSSALGLLLLLLSASTASAYSVLTHEAIIDSTWDSAIRPLLLKRFPAASMDELRQAHAFAYGGCIIQDLGYYPFGSKFFSNLTHYVRSGDFILNLIRDSQDLNEYAFSLGALSHYAADNNGHPLAVNRAVPLFYPKLGLKFGKEGRF